MLGIDFNNIIKQVWQAGPKQQIQRGINSIQHKAISRITSPPDAQAVLLINRCFEILQNPNEAERLQQVQDVVHASLLFTDRNGQTDLIRNVKEFSYLKAIQNVQAYDYPVKITEVQRGLEVTVGTGTAAERGRTDKYFIAKRSGVAGLPAPIIVFFPENKGKPTITNFGSL